MGDKTIRETETIHSFNRNQLSDFLKNLASEILNGKIEIREKEIEIPKQLEVEYGLKEKRAKTNSKLKLNGKHRLTADIRLRCYAPQPKIGKAKLHMSAKHYTNNKLTESEIGKFKNMSLLIAIYGKENISRSFS